MWPSSLPTYTVLWAGYKRFQSLSLKCFTFSPWETLMQTLFSKYLKSYSQSSHLCPVFTCSVSFPWHKSRKRLLCPSISPSFSKRISINPYTSFSNSIPSTCLYSGWNQQSNAFVVKFIYLSVSIYIYLKTITMSTGINF